MKTTIKPIAVLVAMSALTACSNESSNEQMVEKPKAQQEEMKHNIDIWPALDFEVKQDADIEAKVETLLATMTLEQKVAQMIQPEIRDITVEDMRKYGFGSYLNGGGSFPSNNKQSTPQDWINLAEDMYQASIDASVDGNAIPTMWGTDAVHGHNNVIGATLFPHNIGLGAMNNPDLIEKIAEITATEVMVTGIDWVFAPTVAVVRDDRWGRTYESYSEDPEIVREYSASIVKGLQGHADGDFLSDKRVISTVKHFLGDGGTEKGDDQGDNIASEQDLFDLHAQGYVGGLTAGSQSVMASFNSWHGDKIHGNKYLLTDVLKDKMGFDGFVVGDWNGHGQVKDCTNESCPQAVNAGLDMYMVPTDAWKPLYENTIAQVNSGVISQSRIDDAVRRILRVKFRAGLFDKPSPANRQYSGKTELIGAKAHRDVARQAVRESLVLLKNKGNVLPIKPNQNILVAGNGADNIGKQSGGWTVTWQGTGNNNNDFPGGSSIYDGIVEKVSAAGGKVTLDVDGDFNEKPDVAIVVFGEDPYAEGHGDRDNLDYQRGEKSDLALLNKLKAQGIPVVSIFISGRPMWVNAELNASDAFVAAWLPGSEGNGVSDVLFTLPNGEITHDFVGKLSFSWPNSANQAVVNKGDEDYQPLLPYGFGLRYGDENVLADDLDATLVVDETAMQKKVFFDGQMHKPWLMWLYSGDEQLEPNANTHTIGSLSYRTVDRLVQEDSIQLTFAGKEKAGIRLVSKSNFREDLRSAIEANSKLTFMVNVLEKPTANVEITLACQKAESPDDNCGASLDITDEINHRLHHGWSSISIDLACFAEKGMSFGDAVVPFSLSTSGQAVIQIGGVVYEPQPKEEANLTCQ
ncbi:glycoside hydrolase family 3 protein [Thalassotalea eurytherma]|uniref:1,4-beta-D-glucan glucohydrolase n=1 Tax=Thalassotalea eurytherma TaxID=1144278 RepID=A0ABQ6GZR9_9GAMM|nr:exo 1,3/1,4-beta-D-glucan glucohydrolase [Thalassotalea eurytherma]GLX81134.1 1,4-beta-D-glucan glucohydrolase [Thalassotalea eurytherma]